MKIDLHMHSTVSDGTDTPEELLQKVKEAGIRVFSLTDHDDCRGCLQLKNIIDSGDPYFVTGVELSCRDDYGKYHILGYHYDPEKPAIREMLERAQNNRMEKLKGRLEFLERYFGITFSQEDVDGLYRLDNPGKPHLSNLMLKYGYVETREEAFSNYLNKKKFPNIVVSPEEAITAIRGSGGIPVLAHPCFGSGGELVLGDDMDERLKRLCSYGLEGMEAYYSTFTDKLRKQQLDFAEKYDLFITAGSDYHGTNKLVELGDVGVEDEAGVMQSAGRFLEAIGIPRDRI